jgi:alanine-synthesizing transaminase
MFTSPITTSRNYQITKLPNTLELVFSTRVPGDRQPNRLSRALVSARERRPLIDLTLSNPTQAGLRYPPDLLAPLADPGSLVYRPEPFGLRAARDAVARTYAARGLSIEADRIVLTASTSEAYSILFKLLCEPARSDVLTPVPSYPLFDHLTRLDGAIARQYALEYHGTWTIALDDLDRAWTSSTRGVLAVSPNNPTGSVLTARDADELTRRCEDRQAALILDEVFRDYPLGEPLTEAPAFDGPGCLLFRLGGLSKTVGLPQVKLGWIALDGPEDLVLEAIDRLELICDTYLSVSTPVQVALERLLDQGADVRRQILDRIRANYASLQSAVERSGATLLRAEGGWSAVLRVPATKSEEELALDLLERDDVVVHPGYFFDFAHEAFLVVSLLPEPERFTRGVARILERVDAA